MSLGRSSVLSGLAVLGLLLFVFQVAAQDTVPVNVRAVLHDSRSDLYRLPGGAVPWGTEVTLRLQTASGDVQEVSVTLMNLRSDSTELLPMELVATTPEGHDLWEATFPVGAEATIWQYRFNLTKGGRTYFYEDDTLGPDDQYVEANKGGPGMLYEQSPAQSYQISVYDPDFYTPEWFRNAIIYQIFPDRFRDGDPSNNPATGAETFYGSLPLYFHDTWNEPMLDGRVDTLPDGSGYWNSDFYGGDLAGITEKLDYLQSLGVTAIYLNPIFLARSNHRYDTADYKSIDPYLGTLEDFRALVSEAQARGIRLILDGVFNHASSDSPFFDRYHRFETDGACESLESVYRDWFFFVPARGTQPSPCVGEDGDLYYVSWAGYDTIPQINNALAEPRDYFFRAADSVARLWGAEGIGGWRLDAAEQIDDGLDPANDYWEQFRAVVRAVDPEAVIVGEFWHDASPWLLGDQWDSVMNYRFRRGIIGFVREADYVDGDGRIPDIGPQLFDAQIQSIAEDYPPAAYHALMNLMDGHDTSRALYALGNDKQALRLAALIQFTLPGAPLIYYGDEVALDAPSIYDGSAFQDDPYNRVPYPWGDTEGDYYPPPDEEMLAFYQKLGALRNSSPALRAGEMTTLLIRDPAGIYVFLRRDLSSGSAALVAINAGDRERRLPVDFQGLLPNNVEFAPTFGGEPVNTGEEQLRVTVGARSGEVWTADGLDFASPPAPEIVTSESSIDRISLSWSPVEGASGYIIYRSPVAAGGFVPLSSQPVTETRYADRSVSSGFAYYYAVAAVGENGLWGPHSSPIRAIPGAEISAVYYVETRPEVTTTLRYGAQVEIKAAILIDEVTSARGAANGVRAQAALIPAGTPEGAIRWQPMFFGGDQDGADVYSASFSPQTVGDYTLAARFSVDAGQSWTPVTLGDGRMPLLVVAPSDDTTPPDAPANLSLTRASTSGVGLSWEASSDDAVAYRVYRRQGSEPARLLAELSADVNDYLDAAVVSGATYVYQVTALDQGLNESPPAETTEVLVETQRIPVTFVVTVPDGTDSSLYIAGDFGSAEFPLWDPVGEGMQMVALEDNRWTITLQLVEGARIQYKYARGSWEAVEKGPECEEIANRTLTVAYDTLGERSTDYVADGSYVVQDTVAKWRDLDACD